MSASNSHTSQIIEKYRNSATSFEDLSCLLANDSLVKKYKFIGTDDASAIQVGFMLHDGIKPFTFYSNGGAHAISGQNFQWLSFERKDSPKKIESNKLTFKEYRKHALLENKVTIEYDADGYKPYYVLGEDKWLSNWNLLSARDVNFFSRDSQTKCLLVDIIIKNRLNELPFKDWNKKLNIKSIANRTTHKSFTFKDLYDYLEHIAISREIAIVCRDTFERLYKEIYQDIIEIYVNKANHRYSKMKKAVEKYNTDWNESLLEHRANNPQIQGKFLFVKIYDRIKNGEWFQDLSARHNASDTLKMNYRQYALTTINMYSRFILNNDFEKEIKCNTLSMMDFCKKSSIEKIENISERLFKFIEENEKMARLFHHTNELKYSLKEMKKNRRDLVIKRKKREEGKELLVNNTFNCVPYFSQVRDAQKPFYMKTKKGKVIKYANYNSYLNARRYLKDMASKALTN